MRERLRRISLVNVLIVVGVILALGSIVATAYKFGIDRRQDNDIQDVRAGLDQEARNRIAVVEKQQAVDQRQDRLQNAEIARNRRLLIAILKLRDKNPELFEGISLPTTEGFVSSLKPLPAETRKPQRPTANPKPSKPKPVKPKPETPGPTPTKPEPPTATAPTPTPTPTPTPAPTPPVIPSPIVPPPETPVPPIETVPPTPGRPIVTLPPPVCSLLCALFPPILNPIVGG